MADYAWGHQGDKTVRVNPGPLDGPAYGIKTTAADLLRFVEAQIDPRGLAAPMREAVALTQQGLYRAGPLVQGLGWEQYAYPVSREWLLGGNAAEMVATWAISSEVVIARLLASRNLITASTAACEPRRRSIGLQPAATFLTPSE